MAGKFEKVGLTFDDVLLVPQASDFTPNEVELGTDLTAKIHLNIPLMSSAMDTVTESPMAIALAREGGISFIYASQPIAAQAEMIRRVKAYKAGFVKSDSNIRPDATLADVLALKARTGHSTIAVTDDGTAEGKLLGIVTSRDYRVSRMDPTT